MNPLFIKIFRLIDFIGQLVLIVLVAGIVIGTLLKITQGDIWLLALYFLFILGVWQIISYIINSLYFVLRKERIPKARIQYIIAVVIYFTLFYLLSLAADNDMLKYSAFFFYVAAFGLAVYYTKLTWDTYKSQI